MAQMPRGEPRSVPDPAGEQYDGMLRLERLKEQRVQPAVGKPPLRLDEDNFSPFARRVDTLDLSARKGRAFVIGNKTYREFDNGRANVLTEVGDPMVSPAELAERRRGINRALFMAGHPLGATVYGIATLANRSPKARDTALIAGGLADTAMLGASPFGAAPRAQTMQQKALLVAPPMLRDKTRYRNLSANGQAMGADATLTADTIGRGTRVRWNPPGWQGDGRKYKEHRSHLIGKLFGGIGRDRQNAVTMTDKANSPRMSDFEKRVKTRVNDGEVVEYSATPLYNKGVLPPSSILLTAHGSRGAPIARLVENPAGRRK